MSADAESNGTTNGHSNGTAVLDRVIEAWAEDDAAGVRRRGRPKLAAHLNVSEHQVQRALEQIRQNTVSPPSAAHQPATPAPARRAPRPSVEALPTVAEAISNKPDAPSSADHQQADSQAISTLQPPGARFVAWLGFAFGSVMSVAANVLHTWLPADDAPDGWTPGLAPQIGSAVWPIGLLLSVEVLSRVRWRAGALWALARYGGAGTVAIGSGVISYGHLREVLLAWGYGHPGADVGPLVLDGLMVVCGFALLSMTPRDGHR